MITLGPLALALERLFAILGIVVFIAAAGRLGRRYGAICDRGAWRALLFGIVAARVGFVVRNWPAFAAEPVAIVQVWQGGFSPWAGLFAAAIALAVSLRRSPAFRPMATVFAATALTALAATALFQMSVQRPLPGGLVLHALAGEPHPLDARMGEPFVLNLWASWCLPCQREMPMLVEEAARAPVPILLVNQGEDAEKVRAWLAAKGMPHADVLLDREQAVAAAIGSTGLPATVFVDSSGIIREWHVGEISRAALLAGLRELD